VPVGFSHISGENGDLGGLQILQTQCSENVGHERPVRLLTESISPKVEMSITRGHRIEAEGGESLKEL